MDDETIFYTPMFRTPQNNKPGAAIFEKEAKSEGEERANMLVITSSLPRHACCLTCEHNKNQDYCWQYA